MRERERRHNEERPAPPATAGGGNLDGLRAAGNDFLAAGDDAINRALSGDSERFLAASRQEGGE